MRAGRAPAALTTVFLDRDGVINRKAPEGAYVRSWDEFEFLPAALPGLRVLAATDARIVIVTNQRGIALGLMTERDLDELHTRMLAEILRDGGRVDAIEHCPHEHGTCACRKPGTAMFERARRAFPDIEFERSAMVGDSLTDMQAAGGIGALGVLVCPGATAPHIYGADIVVDDLLSAAWALSGAA